MAFDLTDMSGKEPQPNPNMRFLDDNTIIITDPKTGISRTIKRGSDTDMDEFQKSAWTIDKFEQDGQWKAPPDDGKRDPDSEWIPDDKNSL